MNKSSFKGIHYLADIGDMEEIEYFPYNSINALSFFVGSKNHYEILLHRPKTIVKLNLAKEKIVAVLMLYLLECIKCCLYGH